MTTVLFGWTCVRVRAWEQILSVLKLKEKSKDAMTRAHFGAVLKFSATEITYVWVLVNERPSYHSSHVFIRTLDVSCSMQAVIDSCEILGSGIKITVFWAATTCSLVVTCQYFKDYTLKMDIANSSEGLVSTYLSDLTAPDPRTTQSPLINEFSFTCQCFIIYWIF
jgi:hypothetical protein